MTQGRRVKLSANQRMDMWSRWKAGQSLHQIGRAFGTSHVSIHFMLSQHGGIAPTARRRSLVTLTLAEREVISRGIASGSSIRPVELTLFGSQIVARHLVACPSGKIRCVEGRRSVRFASQRSKSEIRGGMFPESKLIHNCMVLSPRKCGR